MATQESSVRGSGINNVLSGLLILIAIGVILAIGAQTFLPSLTITPPSIIIATADVVKPNPTRIPVVVREQPAAPAVQTSIDAYNATATAAYNAAVSAPAPNVDQLPPDAPLPQYVEKAAPERLPAAVDNVSVAEPVTDDTHGEKAKAPVNPQRDHQCLHGQVWTDTGCHRPTPVK